MTAKPEEAADLLAKKLITEDAIEELTSGLPSDRATKVQALLRRYLGWTWKSGLDAHATEEPLLMPEPNP